MLYSATHAGRPSPQRRRSGARRLWPTLLLGAALLAGTAMTGPAAVSPAAAGPTAADLVAVSAPAAAAAESAAAAKAAATKCRNARSVIRGASVTARICWSGRTAWLTGRVWDTAGDSRSAVFELRYSRLATGVWRVREVDMAKARGHGKSTAVRWPANRQVRNVYVRACTANTLRRSCDGRWR